MTDKLNKTLLRDRKWWQIDELDDGELDKQECTQKTGIRNSAGIDKKVTH